MKNQRVAPDENKPIKFDESGKAWRANCIYTSVGLALSGIGLLCIPCVPYFAKKWHQTQSATLTPYTINYKEGVFTKTDKTIPLDKIQDLAVQQNCVEMCMGTFSIHVQTAGSSGQDSRPEAVLAGVENAKEVRDMIMAARNAAVQPSAVPQMSTSEDRGKLPAYGEAKIQASEEEKLHIMREIRDSVKRIEAKH